jgi:hypothetical protein
MDVLEPRAGKGMQVFQGIGEAGGLAESGNSARAKRPPSEGRQAFVFDEAKRI